MRFLCICHTVTPWLSPWLEWLNNRPGNELIVAMDRVNQGMVIGEARKIKLKRAVIRKKPESTLDYWSACIQYGEASIKSIETLAQSGFKPDVILQTTLNGAVLATREIFPKACFVAWLEKSFFENQAEARFQNQFLYLLSMESDLSFAFKLNQFPDAPWLKQAPIGVNTSIFKPSCIQQPTTYPQLIVSLKGLEENEYNSWLVNISSYAKKSNLPILALLPNVQKIKEAAKDSHLTFACNLSDMEAARIFQNANLLIWPDSSLGIEMVQAMSCGLPVAVRDNVFSFMKPDEYLPLPEKDIDIWFQELDLYSPNLKKYGQYSRKIALSYFSAEKVFPPHIKIIYDAMAEK